MSNIFIFHGTGGHPEENWFPWLKKELELLGHKVIIPQFPTPENQTLKNWFRILKKYSDSLTPDAILIAHSLGGAFCLRVLEQSTIKFKAVFIVSAPIGVRPIKNWDGDQPFIGHPFNWEKICSGSDHFVVFHSDNDPYVSLGNGQELAKHLGVQLTFVKGSGHFNKSAGYTKFELLLEKIKEII